MFKAIGKWGSGVKANLSLKFITNLFGSKSKTYNEFESEEEEIFSDAREELLEQDGDDVEDDRILMRETSALSAPNTVGNGSATHVQSDVVVVVEQSSHSDDSSDDSGDEDDDKADGVVNSYKSDDSEQIHHTDIEHHDHKDSDQILETDSKPSNGIIRNASASAFKKVHRRMNSYSQRQYNKMDDNTDESEIEIEKDPNDNIDGVNGAANGKLRNGKRKSKSKDKKAQKRSKIAKKTRKAVRGSWKWFKRGMLGYARAFNAPTPFIINVAGMSASKKF